MSIRIEIPHDVRKYTPELYNILHEIFPYAYSNLTKYILSPLNIWILMFKGEAMIGACNLTKYKPYYTISNFGVVKSQRRYGYGKIMFEYVLKHQKDTVWKVRVSNTPVRRFYEKFGSKIFKSSIDGEFLYYGCI